MQVIDFFSFSFSLLRAFHCIFSWCVSTQRLSIASWCDQNIQVDRRVNKQFLNHTFPPRCPAGEQLHWNQNMAGGVTSSSRSFSFSSPARPAFQSSILFSPAQSCSVVHECQLSAGSTLYLSLPLPLHPSLDSQPLSSSLTPYLPSLVRLVCKGRTTANEFLEPQGPQ